MLGGDKVVYPPNEKWSYREFSGWHQDTEEWTDEETGEVFPPTYSWFATFWGTRVNPTPDAMHFYLRIRVSGEKDKPINQHIALLEVEQAAKDFDTFADCGCVIGQNCSFHGGSLARR